MCAVAGAWVDDEDMRPDPAFPVRGFAIRNGKPTSPVEPPKVPAPLQVELPRDEAPAFVQAVASTTSVPSS